MITTRVRSPWLLVLVGICALGFQGRALGRGPVPPKSAPPQPSTAGLQDEASQAAGAQVDESSAELSLEERWQAAYDQGLDALTPEVTGAILSEAQSKGLREVELDVRYWIGHRAFFYEGPEQAHLHWRFLTDLEPNEATRPHISRAHNSIGLIYMVKGDWITARDHYRLALQMASPSQRNEPRVNLANAEMELGEWRSAVRSYARALEQATPREAFASLNGLADVCLEVELLDAARALLKAAQALLDDPVTRDAGELGAWAQHALDEKYCRLLLEAGAFRAAQDALEQMRRDVSFEEISWASRQAFAEMLAELSLRTGRYEHALATLDENRLLNPDRPSTPSEWMTRTRAHIALEEWEQAWEALERCDPDQMSSQSQGFADYWSLLGRVATETGRPEAAALAARRVQQAEQNGAHLTRSNLRATFSLPGLAPFVGHLLEEAGEPAAGPPSTPVEEPSIQRDPSDQDSGAPGDPSAPELAVPSPSAELPASGVDRRLWLLNGAGVAALLLVFLSWWIQVRRSRELARLQAALDALEDARLEGSSQRERRDASRQALEATLELLDVELDRPIVHSGWGERDVDRMLELAGDCLRLHRGRLDRAGSSAARSDVGRALLSTARRLEDRALERGVALKIPRPDEPVVWNIPDGDLARLLERLLLLGIESSRPEGSLRFEVRGGDARSSLRLQLDSPPAGVPWSVPGGARLDGIEAAAADEGEGVALQDLRFLVLQRIVRFRGGDIAFQRGEGDWGWVLTWPTPEPELTP